jgi:hypothetical protein
MSLHSAQVALYSIYISSKAVTLRLENTSSCRPGKLFCSHNNYSRAYQLAGEIARNRRLDFLNLVPMQGHTVREPAKELALS